MCNHKTREAYFLSGLAGINRGFILLTDKAAVVAGDIKVVIVRVEGWVLSLKLPNFFLRQCKGN